MLGHRHGRRHCRASEHDLGIAERDGLVIGEENPFLEAGGIDERAVLAREIQIESESSRRSVVESAPSSTDHAQRVAARSSVTSIARTMLPACSVFVHETAERFSAARASATAVRISVK